MRFRPDDHYCKPTVARAKKVSNLVLKVKRKRRPKAGDTTGNGADQEAEAMEVEGGSDQPAATSGDGGDPELEYSAEVVGIVNTSYVFPGTYLDQVVSSQATRYSLALSVCLTYRA